MNNVKPLTKELKDDVLLGGFCVIMMVVDLYFINLFLAGRISSSLLIISLFFLLAVLHSGLLQYIVLSHTIQNLIPDLVI